MDSRDLKKRGSQGIYITNMNIQGRSAIISYYSRVPRLSCGNIATKVRGRLLVMGMFDLDDHRIVMNMVSTIA